MPVEAREWKAERAVGGINRGLLALALLIRMEMEKWPIEWAGMLWEKMQSRAAAGSSKQWQQQQQQQRPKATGSIPGVRPLPEGSRAGRTSQIGLDGPLRRRYYCWLRRLGDRVAGAGWMWRGLRDGPNLQRNSTPATIRELGKSTEMGLLSRGSSRWLARTIPSNSGDVGNCCSCWCRRGRREQRSRQYGRWLVGSSKDEMRDW